MNKTKIEWVKNPDGSQGYTWNPITGCLNGCPYCYARTLANGRLLSRYLGNNKIAPVYVKKDPNHDAWDEQKEIHKALLDPFYPREWFDRREEELEGKKPKGIFVCDMSDLFGIGIPEEWTKHVLNLIRLSPRHRFYLLTKQPQNLTKFSPFPDNCWVGVSATDASMFTMAWAGFKDVQAAVKFISFEPLLSWDMSVPDTEWTLKTAGINWAIIGAQTKPYKPPELSWVEWIVEAADKAGIPVFLKNSLEPLVESSGFQKAGWAAKEWVQCKYPVLRQEFPG